MFRTRPDPSPALRPGHVELVPDAPLSVRTQNIAARLDDKSVFDAFQGYMSAREGRRLSQWEAFTLLLALATANPECDFASWQRVRSVSQGGSSRRGGR